MSIIQRMFKKDSLENYLNEDMHLTKVLGAKDLLSMGIGAVIGTGIFILPGTVAATTAGPAIVFSFIIAAIICALAAMAYAELASAMPVAGSAYAYGNLLYGEVIGWVLGWALILEYLLAVAAIATGWSAYFSYFVKPLFQIPTAIAGSFDPSHGSYLNVVAILILIFVGWLLTKGKQTSSAVQRLMVLLKIAIIVLFIVVGFFYIKADNYSPIIPPRAHGAFGIQGVFAGAASVFFAFLGFDAVSSSAAETKNVKRNMPIGIIGTLIVAAILYALVGFVLTGMVHYTHLNVSDPVAFALERVGQRGIAYLLTIGALAGMFTSLMAMVFAGSRLLYAMGRDRLLPPFLGEIDEKNGLPKKALIVVVIIVSIMAGLVPLGQLAELVNMGTLLAFIFVSLGVILLRKNKTIKNDGYKMPLVPVLPIASALVSLYLMTTLQKTTLIAGGIWFVIGILIYLGYGMRRSHLNDK
ncbi:amino acid permease [Periweissella fabaria]|uniref:Amino acid permease YhdG n=1 Tax=Periweissella fabaria TaxID=546157 RepID=A0ABM8Z5S2_9LACO|nr:amino acid permease [Periweissella fabaria]MCM0597544.1 amino acid permease [Periweissella fabaria]CAH0416727.1 putative amino acid permease YhdG [Periweissella fabaria]